MKRQDEPEPNVTVPLSILQRMAYALEKLGEPKDAAQEWRAARDHSKTLVANHTTLPDAKRVRVRSRATGSETVVVVAPSNEFASGRVVRLEDYQRDPEREAQATASITARIERALVDAHVRGDQGELLAQRRAAIESTFANERAQLLYVNFWQRDLRDFVGSDFGKIDDLAHIIEEVPR